MGYRYSSPRCSVCLSPHADAVDTALLRGESAESLSKLTGLGVSSLKRHRAKCLPERVREAMVVTEVEALTPEQLLAQVAEVQTKALRLVHDSELAGDIRERAGALRELRSTVELLAKLSYAAMERPPTAELTAAPDLDAELLAAVRAAGRKTCPKCGADLADRTGGDSPRASLPLLELEAGEVEEAEVLSDPPR